MRFWTLLGSHRAGPSNLDFVAVDKVDRRIEDHLIARLDPGVHFHLGAEIAGRCRPLRLKMMASAGTTKDRDLRGILSSTVQ